MPDEPGRLSIYGKGKLEAQVAALTEQLLSASDHMVSLQIATDLIQRSIRF